MATALELTKEQLRKYVIAARHRPPQQVIEPNQDTRSLLLKRIHEAAHLLYTKYGAAEVILFGSLAHETWFTLDSDVDILVKGIKGNYWHAWEDVEAIIGDYGVDLIDWEMASNSLRQTVSDEGILL